MEQKSKLEMHSVGRNNPCGANEQDKDADNSSLLYSCSEKNREFVQQVVAQIPWGHNIVLMEKVADLNERRWYIEKQRKTVGRAMFLYIR